MENSAAVTLAGGIVAGITGFYAYQDGGFLSALVVAFTVGWMIYRLSSGKNIWETFSMFKNPFMSTILGFLLGFTYLTFKGYSFPEVMMLSLGIAILGGALGMLLSYYWNIGP